MLLCYLVYELQILERDQHSRKSSNSPVYDHMIIELAIAENSYSSIRFEVKAVYNLFPIQAKINFCFYRAKQQYLGGFRNKHMYISIALIPIVRHVIWKILNTAGVRAQL